MIKVKEYEPRKYRLEGFDVNGKRRRDRYPDLKKKQVQEIADQLNAEIYAARLKGGPIRKTRKKFDEAVDAYMQVTPGARWRYIKHTLEWFKDRWVDEITGEEIREFTAATYPNLSNESKNQHGVMPMRAILRFCHDKGWREPIEVKGFGGTKGRKPRKGVDVEWLEVFAATARGMGPKFLGLAEMEWFRATTGSRIGEAIGLHWNKADVEGKDARPGEKLGYVDVRAGTVTIFETKNGETYEKKVLPDLMRDMLELRAERDQLLRSGELDARMIERFESGRVFLVTNQPDVNRKRKAICEEAGIPYATTHDAGRRTGVRAARRLFNGDNYKIAEAIGMSVDTVAGYAAEENTLDATEVWEGVYSAKRAGKLRVVR